MVSLNKAIMALIFCSSTSLSWANQLELTSAAEGPGWHGDHNALQIVDDRPRIRGEQAVSADPVDRPLYEPLDGPLDLRHDLYGNVFGVSLLGEENVISIKQSGWGNSAMMEISGFDNQATVSQSGTSNVVSLSQSGNGNTVTINQRSH